MGIIDKKKLTDSLDQVLFSDFDVFYKDEIYFYLTNSTFGRLQTLRIYLSNVLALELWNYDQ